MSGVKNLRAMFENKGDDASPPDRGRSPSGLSSATRNSDSPRPLSSVRSSFVAIEKDGRMGLRRETSHESSPSRRPMSTDLETESNSTAPPEDVGKASRKLFVNDSIPESPHSPVTQVKPSSEARTEESKTPASEPLKAGAEEEIATTTSSAELPEDEVANKTESTPKAPTPAVKSKMEKGARQANQAIPTAKKTEQPSTKRSAAPSTKVASKGASQAASSTTRTAPSSKRLETKPSLTAERSGPATSRSKQPTAATTKKPTSIKTSQEHNNGFVKPKPKSPTKPVSLPSSLMAPTASSVSKGARAQASTSRQSAGGLQAPAPTQRSSSRASVSTVDTAGTRTVRRKPSTVNQSRPQSRPSIGPPPKKTTQASSGSKKDAPVDEGFLARMMRPTQASSSKTSEKTPATPPKRSVAQRATSASESGSRRGSDIKAKAKVSDPFTDRAKTPNEKDEASGSPEDVAVTDGPEPVNGSAPSPAPEEPEDVPHSHRDDASNPLDTKPDTSPEVSELTEQLEKQSLLSSEHEAQEQVSAVQNEPELVQTENTANPSDLTEEAVRKEDVQHTLDLEVAATPKSVSEETTSLEVAGDVQSSVEPENNAPPQTTVPDNVTPKDTATAETTEQDNPTRTSIAPSTSPVMDNEPPHDSSLPITATDVTSKVDDPGFGSGKQETEQASDNPERASEDQEKA